MYTFGKMFVNYSSIKIHLQINWIYFIKMEAPETEIFDTIINFHQVLFHL